MQTVLSVLATAAQDELHPEAPYPGCQALRGMPPPAASFTVSCVMLQGQVTDCVGRMLWCA